MNCLLLPPEAVHESEQTGKVVVKNVRQIAHIQQVLGLQVGDDIKIGVLDGQLGRAKIAAIAEHAVTLEQMILDEQPPSKLPLTVVLALPRPKVLRRLIMDMTALGIRHIVLVNSYRSEKSYWQSPLLKRLDEFVLEGLEQGVDTVLPTISLKKRFKPFVEDELPSLLQGGSGLVAHPYAESTFFSQMLLSQTVDNTQSQAIKKKRCPKCYALARKVDG